MIISILLNPRFLSASEKNNHYVKVCGILWDTALLGLSLAEKGMVIQLILIANVQKNAEITVSLENLSEKTSILNSFSSKLNETKAILKRLEVNNIISLTKRQRIQFIEENRIEENNITDTSLSLDFEALYQSYPCKKGKKNGIDKLKKICVDQKTYDEVMLGIKNYSSDCKKNNRYHQHFSTFINQETWKEFLLVEPDKRTALFESLQVRPPREDLNV